MAASRGSHVEPEVHDVAVGDDILLALQPQPAGVARPGLAERRKEGSWVFLTLTDPCAVPQTAFQPNPGGTVSTDSGFSPRSRTTRYGL